MFAQLVKLCLGEALTKRYTLLSVRRRRSKVVISSAKPEDSGRYECVAESTSGHRASLAAQLLVAHDTRIPETSEYRFNVSSRGRVTATRSKVLDSFFDENFFFVQIFQFQSRFTDSKESCLIDKL